VLNSVNTTHTRRLLKGLYHRKGPGRKPYNPVSMLKAQILKHLLRIPSDRRLALRLKHDGRAARACGFGKQTPSHGLFTHFRHRLGENTYREIFDHLLRRLVEAGAVKGEVVAVDSTHVDAYSQRALDNRTGRSDPDARVGRARAHIGRQTCEEARRDGAPHGEEVRCYQDDLCSVRVLHHQVQEEDGSQYGALLTWQRNSA